MSEDPGVFGETVRRGVPVDKVAVARMLAEAFEDDPHARWMHPHAGSRLKELRMAFEDSYMESGRTSEGVDLAVVDGDRIVGAALWMNTTRVRTPRTLADWVRRRRIFGSRVPLLMEGARQLAGAHVAEHHWHLMAIATAAEVRGRGYGRALMAAGLARCAADGLPAHLETAKAENVPYYQRFGFEVVATLELPKGGPRNWLMRYEP
ncbi:GNAT family N-acetyltransferase [Nocardia sp. NPDC052001]|uniref:GNAT family N-acetyltransferase n=1 Tax=Nocardia sp. NPDC052001 TaxID=3154853 RepID=UPI0034133EB4